MHRTRSWRRRVAVTVAVVGLLAAACGSSSKSDAGSTSTSGKAVPITGVPGVTDTEIHFSMVGTSTAKNPLGQCTLECFADGIKAYFAYRNSQGGIYGRKLVLDTPLDDELGKGQQTALQIISKNDTLATFSDTIISNYSEFYKVKWPQYAHMTDPGAAKGKETLFGTYSTTALDVPRVTDAFLAKHYNAPKIGVVGYNVGSSQTCVDQIVNEFKGKYSQFGSVVYSNKTLSFGLSNGVGPEVTAMKQAGVQLLFTCIETNGLKTFGQEMVRQDLKAKMVTYGSFEPDFLETNKSVLANAIQQSRERSIVANPSPGRKLYEEWTKKTNAQVKQSTLHGWGAADLMFQGLKKAGAQFDRTKLIDGTNSLKQWTADGLFAPIDIGRQHEGSTATDAATHGDAPNCFVFLEMKSGKLTLVAPATADKPYLCWPGTTYDYSDPTPTSFG